jgi:CheY-like chemotaxis protein
MNAILGYAQLMLRDPSLSERIKESLMIINRSGEHLLALINDILDMSRIEAGKVTLNQLTFDLFDMLAEIELMFRLRAESKGLSFRAIVEGTCERYVKADKGKLRQVLINLLGNAVKFTESGSVAFRVSMKHGGMGQIRLFVAVDDSGPGIDCEEQEKLFRPFAQSESGREAQGGTGLGLAICRELVLLMGGDIKLSSNPGRGATFYFEIPIALEGTAPFPGKETPRRVIGLKGSKVPKVLVVDDEPNNRGWLKRLLESVGFTVQESVNGAEAIRVWKQWNPQLILMDMRMPVMDGMEATKRIRSIESGQPTIILALTASALEENRLAALESGVDDFLSKPCVEEELFEKTRIHLGLSYDFEEVAPGRTESTVYPGATRFETLQRISPSLVSDLLIAIRNGEKENLDKLVERVAAVDETAAGVLQKLSDEYEYDAMTRLLKEVPA